MKIDFVIGSMVGGGAERVVSILANYFAENGHEVRIITFKNGDAYTYHPSIKRIRFHKKAIINYATFRGFFSLINFYFKKKIDLILLVHILAWWVMPPYYPPSFTVLS